MKAYQNKQALELFNNPDHRGREFLKKLRESTSRMSGEIIIRIKNKIYKTRQL